MALSPEYWLKCRMQGDDSYLAVFEVHGRADGDDLLVAGAARVEDRAGQLDANAMPPRHQPGNVGQ